MAGGGTRKRAAVQGLGPGGQLPPREPLEPRRARLRSYSPHPPGSVRTGSGAGADAGPNLRSPSCAKRTFRFPIGVEKSARPITMNRWVPARSVVSRPAG